MERAGDLKGYGAKETETGARQQMETAMSLPVSVQGALMPDAHTGYGLPIGGVLATQNAVLAYMSMGQNNLNSLEQSTFQLSFTNTYDDTTGYLSAQTASFDGITLNVAYTYIQAK